MLPHIQNSEAGRNLYDPVHGCSFEVYFTLPEAIRATFGQDEALLTEHVLSVGGLDALDRGPETDSQKFMGTTRTFIKPKVDDTSAEITIAFSLNLRNGVDNYIYKLLKAWKNLNYDLETGATVNKPEYCAQWLKVSVGNRAGDLVREIVFKDIMLKGNIEGMGDLNYTEGGAKEVTVHFVSDWWKELNA